jgi:hypothetical protein
LPLIVALLGAIAFALVPAAGRAQTSEEFAFRIAVRLTENYERLKFGIQRLDAEGQPRLLHLKHKRFFPLAVGHHWRLRDVSAFLNQAPYHDAADLEALGRPPGVEDADVKVVARLPPSCGQVDHRRWLYSSPLQITRVWSGDLMLDPGATLDTEAPEPAPQPQPAATAEDRLAVVEQDFAAMVSEQCENLLGAYCEEHTERSCCARRES